jgi:catechol 2,3-dioxygenase-like lactoylglutathione lyase family enzyme
MASGKQVNAAVGHVGVEVSDLKKAKKFYKALLGGLGFKIIMDTEDGIGFSNQHFQVWVGESQKPRIKRQAPTGEEMVVTEHLAILVPDKGLVKDIETKMKKEGFEPLFPCEEHPQFEPGYHAVSFCDPDNYVIEVYTRPEQGKWRKWQSP